MENGPVIKNNNYYKMLVPFLNRPTSIPKLQLHKELMLEYVRNSKYFVKCCDDNNYPFVQTIAHGKMN